MDKVLELAAGAGVAVEVGRPVGHADGAATPAHTHTQCLNCGAHLHGRYCHSCGQPADDHHRSIWHLLWEAVEGFTHLDGRLAKTVPALLFHPGQLARDHIEGRRQRHVPPFRLFLISLLIFMFVAEAELGHGRTYHATQTTVAEGRHVYQVGNHKVVVATGIKAAKEELDREGSHNPTQVWLRDRIGRAVQNPEYFVMLMFDWAHRLAVLSLPILAALLTLCYVYKRKFYVYDHLVVAMQYLSFCFLIWSLVWLAPFKSVSEALFLTALAWTPFNLYLILRTAYGSSRIGAGVKALALWSSTVVVFFLLLGALTMYVLTKM